MTAATKPNGTHPVLSSVGIPMEEQIEHLATPSSDGAPAVLALIERVALDPGADAAKLERIVAMYARLRAKEAELAFNVAKGRILKSSPTSSS